MDLSVDFREVLASVSPLLYAAGDVSRGGNVPSGVERRRKGCFRRLREVSVIQRIKIMKKGRYTGRYPYLSECLYHWPYLVSLLSGQARLVRATAEGGGGIHLIHGLSSSDSDDDDDFGDEFPCCDVPSPPGTLRAKSYFISYNSHSFRWPQRS